MSLILKSVIVVDLNSEYNSKKVNILIDNSGAIDKISLSRINVKTSTTKVIDCDGMMVSPGWFDFRSNFCDPGFEHKEDLTSGSKLASFSGFTDILLMPNTNPILQSKNDIYYVKNKTENDLSTIHPTAAITKNTDGIELNEILDLNKAGAVAFTDGEKELQNSDMMYKALLYIKQFDGLLINKPKDFSLSRLGIVNEGHNSTISGLKGIPNIAEEIMLNRDLSILRYSGGKLHFSGISTKSSVDIIRKAKQDGLNVTCDVSIYNLILDDSHIINFDTNYKLDPPLRTKDDIDALIKGLEDGTIDVISSYHQPQNIENKSVEFNNAENGMISLQTFFSNILILSSKISLESLITKFTSNPRKILNLEDKSIKVGSNASLTIFDINGSWDYSLDNNISKSFNSPWLNWSLKGKIFGIINSKNSNFNY